jgi:tRNA threonylcarbamoyladenosine biosynthesis protein TsaE
MVSAHAQPVAASVTREELIAWGERLGSGLRAPRVLAISGELGTGKTTLVQAICRGYGVREPVTSPTFALVHEYNGPTKVFHMDLYRLTNAADVTNVGWDDVINSDALVLVEWPERAQHRLPQDAMKIELAYVEGDENRRMLKVEKQW